MANNKVKNPLVEAFCDFHSVNNKLKKRIYTFYTAINKKIVLSSSLDDMLTENEILNFLLVSLSSNFYDNKTDEQIMEDIIYKYKYIISNDNQDIKDTYSPLSNNLKTASSFLKILNAPYSKVDPTISLIGDMFNTVFLKLDSISSMLSFGFYTEAYASWRSIHESECIIYLLTTGGRNTQKSYIKHIAYNNAYRNPENFSVEDNDYTFLQIKKEMKEHNLKSKDMKKFIEYGWLYSYPNINADDVKLNFRDGIEKLANLSKYNFIYEGASELVHSSSSFFYVNSDFCKNIALDMTYQSAIRIFNIYHLYYAKLFENKDNEKEYSYFLNLLNETLDYIKKNFDDSDLFENDYQKRYRELKENYDK